MFYVYEWFNVNSGEVIYVGKGTKRRYKVRKHNKLFNELISKVPCDSRIIAEFPSEEEAFLYEQERIAFLKSKGECECNIYKGGFGGSVADWSDDKRKQYSEHNVMKSKEQRTRMSLNNPMKDPDVSAKVGKSKARAVFVNNERYEGVKQAAETLGVWEATVTRWCKRGYNDKGQPCRYADEEQKQFEIKITSSRKVVVDGISYPSVNSAAKFLGVWPESVIRSINQGRPCKGHLCRYDNQPPNCENPSNSIAEGSTTNE